MKPLHLVALAGVLSLSGCGLFDDSNAPTVDPCSPGTACGTECCTAEQLCNAATKKCEAACVPSCRSRECGSDGCGGTCGDCQSGFLCQEETGLCYKCKPNCNGKICGSDGCGGSCGTCSQGLTCQGGNCEVCKPNCNGKLCGPDGCGGQCGTCGSDTVCDSFAGRCVECMGDQDCAGSSSGQKCSFDRRCVACQSNSDCRPDGSIQCDTSTGRCKLPCTSDAQCLSNPGANRCDALKGECVACLTRSDCSSPYYGCDSVTRSCVTCMNDSDCSSAGKGNRCLNRQACVQCISDADCGGGRCNTSTNTCAECFQDSDCSGNASRRLCDAATTTCVQCRSDTNCSGGTPACSTTLKSCVQCTSDSHCGGETPRCSTSSNTCVQCASDSDCGSAKCQFGQCTGPRNDSCTAPTTLDLSSGAAQVSSSLSGGANDWTGTCGGTYADAVFKFTLTATRDVTATVTGSLYYPVVYFSTSCGGAGELACNRGSSSTATATAKGLQPGTYYLWVDTDYDYPASYSLSVTATEPVATPSNDTCSSPQTLQFDAAGKATVSSTTNGTVGNYTGYYCSSSGPDVVYQFTTTVAGAFSATVTPKGSSPSYRPILLLRRTSCSSNSSTYELDCASASAGGSAATLSLSSLSAGTYYLIVDGYSSSSGDFDLTVNTATAGSGGGESCAAPATLTFANNSAFVSSSTSGNVNDTQGSCGGAGPDKVYKFEVQQTSDFSAHLTNLSGSAFHPGLYLRSGTCSTASDLGCLYAGSPGGNVDLSATLSAGTYYLWVDGYNGTYGSFEIEATLTPPSGGMGGADSCLSLSSSHQIALSSGFGSATGNTSAATDHGLRTCSSYSGGKDTVHWFYVPSGYSNLWVTVQADGWIPTVELRHNATHYASSYCSASSTTTCKQGTTAGSAVSLSVRPSGGYYFVWVDGYSASSQGSYELSVEVF